MRARQARVATTAPPGSVSTGGSDEPATDTARSRPPSEFAEYAPLLDGLARMAPDDPDREALRQQLILAFLPLGERIAARLGSGNLDSRDDLAQVASVGVINAVNHWNPDRAEGDVLGYFVPCVRGEILRYFRDRTWATRVPRRLKELGVSIGQITGPLTQQLGRAPRPSELAKRLGVGLEDVLEALRAGESRSTVALDSTGASDEPSLGDRLGGPDGRLDAVPDLQSLHGLLDQLPERERRILLLRFYGDRTQSQIAEEIGISQMHVSRLLSRTLAGLRRALVTDERE